MAMKKGELDFSTAFGTIERDLRPRRMRLLQLSGFCKSFDEEVKSDQSSQNHFGLRRDYCGSARTRLVDLHVILSRAAVLLSNEKSTNGLVLNDLDAVVRQPRRLTHSEPRPVSSEAAVLIAKQYLRGEQDEAPGSYWYDLLELNPSRRRKGFVEPAPERLKEAAKRAIARYTKPTERRERIIGRELQSWFISKPKRKNSRFSPLGTPFLEIVAPTLNKLLVTHGGRLLNLDHLLEDLCRKYETVSEIVEENQ